MFTNTILSTEKEYNNRQNIFPFKLVYQLNIVNLLAYVENWDFMRQKYNLKIEITVDRIK